MHNSTVKRFNFIKSIQMATKRRLYDRDFKEKAVQLSYERGNAAQIERELNISPSLLCKWRQEYEKFGITSFCGKGNAGLRLNCEQQKIMELERKVKHAELKYEILKKGSHYSLQNRALLLNFIENNETTYSTKKMCRILGVGELTYFKYKNQLTSKTQHRIILLKEVITSLFMEAKQRHGSSTITRELQNRGYKVKRYTVGRYMAQLGLRKKTTPKYKVTTDSKHNHYIAPNLLNRKFTVDQPGKVWVSDITYLQTTNGFLYLTIILDLFDRKVIGWKLSNAMTTKLTTIPAWEMASRNRKITGELLFHSDRGVQYANRNFTKLLDSCRNVKRSMSRKGDCLDNAVAESFFSTLKRELIHGTDLFTPKQMNVEIFDFIENWYNKKRRHSKLNYVTIAEFGKNNNL